MQNGSGLTGFIHLSGNADITRLQGIVATADKTGNGTAQYIVGLRTGVTNSAGTVAEMVGVDILGGSATGVVNNYQFRAGAPTGTGITNSYGLYLPAQKIAGVVNGYGIRQVGANDLNILDGSVQSPRHIFASGTEPACSSTTRGTMVQVYGGAGVADTIRICGKSAADTYSYQAVATF